MRLMRYLLRGTLTARTSAWARTQAIGGFMCFIFGIILLAEEKTEVKATQVQYKFTLSKIHGQVYVKTDLAEIPHFQEVTTKYVPSWDAGLTVLAGVVFFIMGCLLCKAIKQKSATKCTIWLMGTVPMLLILFCASLYKWYETPNLQQLTNAPFWGLFANCVYVVCMFRKDCLEIQIRGGNSRAMHQRRLHHD